MVDVKLLKKAKGASGRVGAAGGGSGGGVTLASVDEAKHAERADKATWAEGAGYSNEAGTAAVAAYADKAGDVAEGSPLADRFLSRLSDDEAAGLIGFLKGFSTGGNADFGSFLGGWMGSGARIDAEGNAEFESVRVRGSMTASELVFNLINAEEGESIRSIGRGEVLEVWEQSGTTGYLSLKLEGDAVPTVAEGDICRGTYSTFGTEYTQDDTNEDGNGFRQLSGFFTSYFTIDDVREGQDGEWEVQYTLQSASTPHPTPGMRFVAYGNKSDTSRQSCMYISAVGQSPRVLFLTGVNQYKIRPANIKLALGNIEGVKVWTAATEAEYAAAPGTEGVDKMRWAEDDGDGQTVARFAILETLHGDAGLYCEDNIYLGGVINQLKAAALEAVDAEIDSRGQARVTCNFDTYPVNCDTEGRTLADDTISLEGHLWLGSTELEVTAATAEVPWQSKPNSGGRAAGGLYWSWDLDIDEGMELGSCVVRLTVTGKDSEGNSHTAGKTVAVLAVRAGEKGEKGDKGDTGQKGDKGDKGDASDNPMPLRTVWKAGEQYLAGGEGERYYHLVNVGRAWYRCVKSHTASEANKPDPSGDTAWWERASNIPFLASGLVMADEGVIELLHSNTVVAYNETGQKTASMNADGAGSYCIYYPGSGNKMMEMGADGYIRYYNDDEGNTEAWRLGHGGDITKGTSDDWTPLWLKRHRSR